MGILLKKPDYVPPVGGSTDLSMDYPFTAYADTEIVFTVRIASTQGTDKTFTYATANSGTGDDYATQGTDFTSTSGTGTITAGDLYTQIAVPIAGNTPPNGRHELQMTITDSDTGGQLTTKGVILDAIHVQNYDYPSVGAATKQNWYRQNQAGSWINANLSPTNGNASITSSIPAAVGVNCVSHNMETSTGAQSTIGIDTLANIQAGDIFDGLEYYYRWFMRVDAAFVWNGSLQDKIKSGRLVRTNNTNPPFTTMYLQGHRMYWQQDYPASANNTIINFEVDVDTVTGGTAVSSNLVADLGTEAAEWREYILYQKRQSAYGVADGIGRLIVNGQIAHERLNMEWTESGETEPGDGVTTVRFSNMGLFTWFQNQIGVNGETTGGMIYTDGHTCTEGHWPSSQYARPW